MMMPEVGDNPGDVSLKEFLDEHFRVLTILGVFGAFALYLKRITDGELPAGMGVTASLLLSILLSFVVFRGMVSEFGGINGFAIGMVNPKNIDFLVFTVLLFLVMYSTLEATDQFPSAKNAVFVFGSFAIGAATGTNILSKAAEKLAEVTTISKIHSQIITILLAVLMIMGIFYVSVSRIFPLNYSPDNEFSLLGGLPVFFIAFIVGTVYVLAIYSWSISLDVLALVYDRARSDYWESNLPP